MKNSDWQTYLSIGYNKRIIIHLELCNHPTDTQPDVVRHNVLLSTDQLYQRRSCSLSLDDVEDCQMEMKNRRRTYCTSPQYRLRKVQQYYYTVI